jgi:ferrous iron transport protein A
MDAESRIARENEVLMESKVMSSDGTSLSAVRSGESVHVRAIEGGLHVLSRLAALGFTPGARVTVIQNRGRGPLIVALRGTRVALGRGEAAKIQVERLAGGSDGR